MYLTKTNIILIIVALIIGIGAVEWFIYSKIKIPPIEKEVITSFEECVKAGYPILESYPEQCQTPDGQNFVHQIQVDDKSDKIIVNDIPENTEISSPLVITGQARGFWFFEASFPVALEDATGQTIAFSIAQADGEWMTEDFVPFATTLTFGSTTSTTGTLVFKKNNPSGLPENDDELRIPVKINTDSTQ